MYIFIVTLPFQWEDTQKKKSCGLSQCSSLIAKCMWTEAPTLKDSVSDKDKIP